MRYRPVLKAYTFKSEKVEETVQLHDGPQLSIVIKGRSGLFYASDANIHVLVLVNVHLHERLMYMYECISVGA